jgi:hypothetical protein
MGDDRARDHDRCEHRERGQAHHRRAETPAVRLGGRRAETEEEPTDEHDGERDGAREELYACENLYASAGAASRRGA